MACICPYLLNCYSARCQGFGPFPGMDIILGENIYPGLLLISSPGTVYRQGLYILSIHPENRPWTILFTYADSNFLIQSYKYLKEGVSSSHPDCLILSGS